MGEQEIKVGDVVRVKDGSVYASEFWGRDLRVEKIEPDGCLTFKVGDSFEEHLFAKEFVLQKAPVGQLGRFNGETWDAIEELVDAQVVDEAEDGWYDVTETTRGKLVQTAISQGADLGLEIRVQARRAVNA